jgi:hypothetical protein
VTVNTGSGDGTIRLNVVDNDTIMDGSSFPLGGTGTGNGSFITGQVYTINKTLTFISSAAQDGWLLETSELSSLGGTLNSTAGTIRLGDDATRKQFLSILSFSTSSIPDTAVITGVTLKVHQHSVTGGGNPLTIFQGFMADIKTGIFGSAATLQTSDFQAATSKTLGPTSPTPANGGWFSLNLTAGKTFINPLATSGGLTQIRLRFKLDDNNNGVANFLSLHSSNSPTVGSRPQLVITYYVP